MNVTQKKLCVKLVTYRTYTKMHGQKNIMFCDILIHHISARHVVLVGKFEG
jgi:hypothetical protein